MVRGVEAKYGMARAQIDLCTKFDQDESQIVCGNFCIDENKFLEVYSCNITEARTNSCLDSQTLSFRFVRTLNAAYCYVFFLCMLRLCL